MDRDLIQAFRKALSLYGQVFDFPVLVQYESGRLDAIPSAQLKDIAYAGEAYEVLFAMQNLDFMPDLLKSLAPSSAHSASAHQETCSHETLSDEEIAQLIQALRIEKAI